jgi:hypothetical protein
MQKNNYQDQTSQKQDPFARTQTINTVKALQINRNQNSRPMSIKSNRLLTPFNFITSMPHSQMSTKRSIQKKKDDIYGSFDSSKPKVPDLKEDR